MERHDAAELARQRALHSVRRSFGDGRPRALVAHTSRDTRDRVVQLLRYGLHRDGVETITVPSDRHALSAELGDLWLACVSVDFGAVDGFDLARRLKERYPHAEIVLCHQQADDSHLEAARYAGSRWLVADEELPGAIEAMLPALRLDRRHLFDALVRERTAIEISRSCGPELARRAGYRPPPPREVPALGELARTAVSMALEEAAGNRALAARKLGITRQRLYRLLEKTGATG